MRGGPSNGLFALRDRCLIFRRCSLNSIRKIVVTIVTLSVMWGGTVSAQSSKPLGPDWCDVAKGELTELCEKYGAESQICLETTAVLEEYLEKEYRLRCNLVFGLPYGFLFVLGRTVEPAFP